MAKEQERLELVATVEEDFEEPLNRLESALESVDDEIRQTGRGRDEVEIHTEVTGVSQAVGELEALDAAITSLDDDITLDVESDFDDVLRDDVRVNRGGRGSQFINERTGQFTSVDESLDRRFSEIADAIEDELTVTGDVDIDAGHVDVDAAHGGASGPTPVSTSGGTARNDFSGEPSGFLREVGFLSESNKREMRQWWGEAIDPVDDQFQAAAHSLQGELQESLNDLDMEGVLGEDMDPFVTDDDLEVKGLSVAERRRQYGVDLPDIDDVDLGFDAGDPVLSAAETPPTSISELGEEFKDMRFTMGSFHNIIASLIPLLGVYIGAIPAAIVGIGALATAAVGAAAALAGIAGLGAVGMMLAESGELDTSVIQERLSEVGDTYLDAFAPLAESFAPTIERAITEVEAMAGPLADASAYLRQFRDDFEGFTNFVTSALPSFTGELLAFTDAAMPLLTNFLGAIVNVDYLGYFASQLSTAWPALVALGSAMMEILPMIVNLSQGFLVTAGMLTYMMGSVAWALNAFPNLTRVLGVLASMLLVLVTATTLYTLAQSNLISTSLGLASTILTQTVPALASKAAALVGVELSAWGAYAATAALLGLLTLGAVFVIPRLTDEFLNLGDGIQSAREELERFANVNGNVSGVDGLSSGMGSPTGGSANVYRDNSTTVINAGDRDAAARQQYSSEYEKRQHVDSVFGG